MGLLIGGAENKYGRCASRNTCKNLHRQLLRDYSAKIGWHFGNIL